MKFKSFFAALVAAIAFWACVEENPIAQFTGMELSSDYIAIPAEGGSAEFTVKAEEDWTVKIDEAGSKWLTVDPVSGKAGESVKVTVSAPMASASRKASVSLVTATKTKIVTVAQQGDPNAVSTCKDVMEGKDGTTFRVKGKVTSIVNTQYGNLYINDGTVEGDGVYIYGVKNDKLQYPKDAEGGWESFGIGEGDVVTVKGPKKTYNGTVELVDVEIIAVEAGKDPIISSIETEKIVPFAATSAKFTVNAKNLTEGWTVTTDADWITDYTKSGPKEGGDIEITFAANEVEQERTATFTVKSAGAADLVLTLKQEAFSAITNVTCAELNEKEDGSALFRVKGVITQIVMDKNDAAKYNAYGNFYISDETGTVYVYGLLPEAGGAQKQDVLTTKGIKVGDVITVVGPKGSYKGSPQMVNAYYESHTSVTTTTCEAFNALEDGDALFLLKGTVTEIVMDKNDATKYNKYGNLYIEDATGKAYIYGIVPVINAKSGQDILTQKGVKVGDVVTVVGPKGSYKNSPQMVNGFLVEVEEGAAPVAGITIDGDMSDWESIDACASTGTSRIRSWKFATDANNLYFYLVLRKNRMRTEYGVTLAFDWDESGSLSADNLSGAEAVVVFQPFTNSTSGDAPTCVNGAVTTAKVNGAEGTTVSINVYGVNPDTSATGDSADYYLELSIPRSDIPGLPAAGSAIKIGIGYEWYNSSFQSVTL